MDPAIYQELIAAFQAALAAAPLNNPSVQISTGSRLGILNALEDAVSALPAIADPNVRQLLTLNLLSLQFLVTTI